MATNHDDVRVGELTEFLGGFSEDNLRKIFDISEVQQFAKGDTVLTRGDPDTSIYIVLEGQAEVLIEGKKGMLALATLIPGSIFGELSFFDQRPRSARVSVTADCTVLKISEPSFQSLVSQDMGVAMAFVQDLTKILSLRVRYMNQLVQTLAK